MFLNLNPTPKIAPKARSNICQAHRHMCPGTQPFRLSCQAHVSDLAFPATTIYLVECDLTSNVPIYNKDTSLSI